jgi:hypothetical protein
VTQDNIHETICVTGYTKTVRPPTSYTNPIKKQLMTDAGIDLSRKGEFELDHIVPLELGGAPRAHENLALQLLKGVDGARRKDKLENKLNCMACAELILLEVAQYKIANDWEAAYQDYDRVYCTRAMFK